ncbi:ATP-binding protein [Thermodesulfatator atlanticus]|uniref:ATP-binding protein n=1 Tax=Thermodesulfatator atlanticus TaxID=501497 RepID=UPI0003B67B0D|nr:ATP-binding protein [Thermodesulfatator atlanticus]
MLQNSRVKIYVPRFLEEKITRYLEAPEIIAVLGARQVGKTTLLKRLYERVPGPKIFLDFEDPEVLALFEEDVKAFARLYIEGKRFIFIDEFQYSQDGGQKLKFLYDHYEAKFFISGSSSLEISLKTVSFLVGRIFIFELYPFSFGEILWAKDPKLFELFSEGAPLPPSLHERFLQIFEEYCLYGGYPRVVLAKDHKERQEVLKNILRTYLLKDIRGFFRLATESHLQKLIKALALQIGNLVRYQELSPLAELSVPSLKKHLAILEETYIIKLLKPFYTNRRVEIVKNPKVYFWDLGLRNYLARDFRPLSERPDQGTLVENAIAVELFKKGLEVNYWRSKSGAEVDFVIQDRKPLPVEVKAGVAKSPGKSLLSFLKRYASKRAFILHRGQPFSETREKTELYYLPWYEIARRTF